MDGGTSDESSKEQMEERQKPPPKPPPESVTAEGRQQQQQHPPPQKCPRCDSSNTKFCYYNNYSLAQPRYFCKACRRYWTHGGNLRNVPIGGGSRKAKRPRIASASYANSEINCSSAPISSQNLAGMISGQSLRSIPHAVTTVGSSFYSGGGVMSGFGVLQSLQGGGMNHGSAVSYGGGPYRFGANMSILQGMGLSGYRNMPPPSQLQFHSPAPDDHGCPSQQSLSSWLHPSLLQTAGVGTTSASSSAACCNSAAGSDDVGASFSQNQWQESDPGFHHPPQ